MRPRLEAKDGKEEVLKFWYYIFGNISDFVVVGRQQVGDKQDGHQDK